MAATKDPDKIKYIAIWKTQLFTFQNDLVFNENQAICSNASPLSSAKSSTESEGSTSPIKSDVSLSPISPGPIELFKEKYQNEVNRGMGSPAEPTVSPDPPEDPHLSSYRQR